MKINEIFKTIQGEATYTGTPSLFIRTQGCPVWCGWCDTKFTWHNGKKSQLKDKSEIIEKVGQDERFTELANQELLEIAKRYKVNHIVITGGEPCINDLTDITTLLIDNGFSVQIETSCTQEIKCHNKTWITGSPKINMAGRQEIKSSALQRADEIKFPILNENDLKNLLELIIIYQLDNKLIWLQPVDLDGDKDTSLKLCLEACYQHNFRLSIQTHKYIGLK